MEKYFDDGLLETFAKTFYGYGDYNGPYWFIGMEEGGGDSFENVNKRLSEWNKRGKQELEDVAEFHRAIGIGELFNDSPKLQPTWNKLIRILLSAKGQEYIQTEDVREYQRTLLGKAAKGENCLIELFPLPSPSTNHWIYAQHSKLAQLINRPTYKEHYINTRTNHVRERIDQYRPGVVVFYGITYLDYWQRIVTNPTCSFDQTRKPYLARRDGTLFVVTDHPAALGLESEYFQNVGKRIASELAKSHAEFGSSVEARN